MQLQSGALLQGGKYKIESVLGQGGFGITYLGWQIGLNRRVAIKEFFMKEYCNRDASTSRVSIGTEGSRNLVDCFRQKFVKEAQTIAGLDHPHVVRIHDVFEENGTAYYVMEYVVGGSLQRYVAENGPLQEQEALFYIRDVATALQYIHEHQMNHLDVKPDNILRRENAQVVLIDFGLSKHYDESGHQMSTTPVGISTGYAPIEQYKKGGVGTFSPATDIYSLGATLYKLLTGKTPPDANDLLDEELPPLPAAATAATAVAIRAAMQPQRSKRPQSIREFLGLLDHKDGNDESTVIPENPQKEKEKEKQVLHTSGRKKNLIAALAVGVAVLAVVIALVYRQGQPTSDSLPTMEVADSTVVVAVSVDSMSTVSNSGETLGLTKPSVNSESNEESLYQSNLKTASSLYNKKKYESSKDLFVEMQGKYPAHQAELKKWIAKCDAELEKQEKLKRQETATATATPVVTEIKPSSNSNEPTSENPVDLGLSVKWAAYNVGASSPEGYGGLYGWADPTGEKRLKYYDDYPSANPPSNISGTQYDIARAKWGSGWRLPTQKELVELSEKCTWKWITYKGVNGYLVTGRNGNRIFLPAAGFRDGGFHSSSAEVVYYRGSSGYYWSGTLSSSLNAYELYFGSDNRIPSNHFDRYYGQSVRPVSE